MATAGRPFCSRRASKRTRFSCAKLNLGCVFDHQHAFVCRNEFSKDREQRGFSRAGAAANEDVFACEDVVFEVVCERAIERAGRESNLPSRSGGY